MNYLAHLYLSGENELLKVGNFIGDYVKGKQFENFDPGIRQGILMHRQIDYYTDHHLVVKDFSSFFREKFGRYSGILSDIIFDHFLASNWQNYSDQTLRQFSKNTHAVLLSNFNVLPARVKLFLPFLIQHKRLESYANFDGVYQSLKIMSKRTSLPDHTEYAMEVLKTNYRELQLRFEHFFADLLDFVETNYEVKIKKPA
ncbi:acyl carrier protein phosphodiesterase [Sunxiuqinia sp. A32]|uniref:acyl carrier protein phosphodiesterase n=1 Tax=Sunxiuqinia sp. A32 TaxID=3461496 RepID=UPI00404649D1